MKVGLCVSLLVVIVLVAVVFAPLPSAKAASTVPSLDSYSIEWINDGAGFKKAIVHLETSDGPFSFLIEGVVQQVGPEHIVDLSSFLLLDNGTQVLAGTADGAVYDTLYGAPYAPEGTSVETIKIHIDSITALALAIASIIIIAAIFYIAIVAILAEIALDNLLDSLQWAIFHASIPWVYLTLYQETNPDLSLTLFIPMDQYIIPMLSAGKLYVATSYSWWLIEKHTWSWFIFSFDYYSATWIQPLITMPPAPPAPPFAAFVWNPDIADPNEEVAFHSTSYDPDGEIVNWHWYFGDGAEASGETTTHKYAYSGFYDVRLVVTDDDGMTAEASTSMMGVSPVFVVSEPPVVAAIMSAFLALVAFTFIKKRRASEILPR